MAEFGLCGTSIADVDRPALVRGELLRPRRLSPMTASVTP
jgi:hypothetical protein